MSMVVTAAVGLGMPLKYLAHRTLAQRIVVGTLARRAIAPSR